MKRFALRIGFAALLAWVATAAYAASYTSTTNGNWSSASTWGGAGVPGAGDFATVNNTVTLDVPVTVNTLTMNNTITGTQSLTVTNTFQWNGGTLSGGLTASIPSGATMTLLGYGTLDGSTLNVAGTFALTSTYYIYMLNNASLINSGTIDFQGDGGIYLSGTLGTTGITNGSTIQKSGGTATSTITIPIAAQSGSHFNVNSGSFNVGAVTSAGGTFNVASGSTLNFNTSDTRTFDASSSFTGSGTVAFQSGTNTVSGNLSTALTQQGGTLTINSASAQSVSALTMINGTLTANADLTVNGASTWSGGTIGGSGALTIPNTTTVTVNGAFVVDGKAFGNAGTINVNSTSYFYLQNNAVLTNSGTLNFLGDGAAYLNGTLGTTSVVNSGIIEKSGGTGGSTFDLPLVAQSGSQFLVQSGTMYVDAVTATGATVNVASGATLVAYYNSTRTFDAASTVSGAGSIQWNSGTNTVNGNYNITGTTSCGGSNTTLNNITNVGNVSVSSGTLTLNAASALSVPALTMTGGTLTGTAPISLTGASMTWSGGTISGSGLLTIPLGTTVTLTSLVLDGRPLENAGFIAITSNGAMYVQNNAQVTNDGTIDFQSDGSLYMNGTVGTTALTNNSTIKKSAGTNGSTMNVPLLAQSGSQILAQSGPIFFGPITATGASFSVSSGATLYFYYNDTRAFDAATTISGAGAVQFGSGTNTVNAAYNITGSTTSSGGTTTISNITSVGALTASGGTMTLNSASTLSVPTLTMSGGILTGTAPVSVTGASMTWSSGTLSGSGAITIPVGTTVTVNSLTLDTRALSNAGTIVMPASGGFYVQNNATVSNSGTWDLQSDASVVMNGATGTSSFTNSGTVKKSAGSSGSTFTVPLVAQSGSQFLVQSGPIYFGPITATGATFSVSSGATIYFYYNEIRTFDAASALSGAGAVQWGSGTNTVNGTYNITGTTTATGGTTTLSNIASVGSTLTAQGGTLTLNGASPLSLPTLTMSGGTLSGTLPINITGTSMTWSSGTLGGSGQLSIPAGTTITVNSITIDTRPVVNAGTIAMPSSAAMTLQNNGTLSNSGTLDIQGDGNIYLSGAAGSVALTNSGTLKKSGGVNGSSLTAPLVETSGGQLLVQSSVLYIYQITSTGGAFSMASGTTLNFYSNDTRGFDVASTISGPGTLQVSNGTNNVSGTITAPVALTGGTFNINSAAAQTISALNMSNGTFGGTGNVTVGGASTWTGGTFNGTGTLTVSNTTTITLSGYPYFDGKPVTNNGTINFTTTNYAYFQNGAILTNSGTIDFQNDGHAYLNGTAGTTAIVNNGTIKKSGGTGTSYFTVPLTAQGGSQFNVLTGTEALGAVSSTGGAFNIASGATLQLYTADTRTFDAASTIAGAGTLYASGGTSTVSGTLSAPIHETGGTLSIDSATTQSIPTLTMAGGTLAGSGNLTLTGPSMNWTGGTIGGSGTLTIQIGTTVTMNGYPYFDGRPITNAGTFIIPSTYYAYMQNNAVFTNSGTLDFQGDGALYVNGTTGSTAIVDTGILEKSGGTGSTTINVPLTIQSGGQLLSQSSNIYVAAVTCTGGTVSAASGAQISFNTSDTRTFDAASTLSGPGTLQFLSGTNTITGTLTASLYVGGGTLNINSAAAQSFLALNMAGGILGGTANLSVTGSAMSWNGGTIGGTGTLTIPAGTTVTLNGYPIIDARPITIAGSFVIPSTYYAYMQNNAVMNVSGTFDIQGDGAFYLSGTPGTTALDISGIVKKSGGTSSPISVPINVQSGGQLQAQAGTLYVYAVNSTGGTLNAASGASIVFNSSDVRSFDAATTFSGAGTISHSAGTSTFAGTITSNLTVGGGTFTINSAAAQSIPQVNLAGGTLNGSGAITITGASSSWTGGTVGGSGAFAISPATTVSISGYPFLDTRTLTNNGTIRFTSAVYLYLQNNAAIVNNGTVDFQADASIIQNIAPTSFTNNGTIMKSLGTSSSITVPATNAAAGVIQAGTGNITFSNTLTNAGTMDFPIAGAALFGTVTVSGAFTLNGTLTVTTTGGYAPSTGTAFQLLNYGSKSGSFTNKNLDYATGTFTETYSATNLTVTAGPQALGITTVSPSAGTSAGGTTVTISGVDFQANATVTFGGTAAASVTFNNSTSITAVTPPHAVGPADVVVTNPSTTQSATLTNDYLFTGLVSQYSFETTGSLGKDTAGTNDATNVVNVTQVPGKVAQAGSFSSGYMDLPQANNLNLRASDFTLDAWVNSSSTSNLGWFTKETALGAQQYGLGTANQTQAVFSFDGGSGGSVTSTSSVFDGTWHHVAAVKRGSTAEIWVDGVLEASAPVSGSSDTGAFAIGRSGACCDTFNGLIDEAKIYNHALSASQIQSDANAADVAISKSATASVVVGQSITYTLTVTNNGPSSATGVTVTDTLPGATSFVSATPSQGACSGTSTVTCSLGTLANGGTATITIVANATAATIATNSATVTANESDPVATNNTASASTTINSPTCSAPTVTASGATTFCAGGAVTLSTNATGVSAYQWYNGASPIGGATGASYTATTSGSYAVQVTYTNTCSATSAATTVTVNANPPTPLVSSGGPTTFCQGGSVTLTAPAGYTYAWSNGATTQAVTITTSGNYTVTVTDTNGCSAVSAAINVAVNPAPNATISAPASLCTGTSGTASVPITSGATYSWSATNATINSGAASDTINFTPAGTSAVTLNVSVTDANGCTSSGTANVGVGSFTPSITPSGPTTFCQGGSVTLTATAGQSYLWSTGQTSQSITVTASGTFTVSVTSAAGCGGSSSPVTVTANPNPTPAITASGPTTFCQGGSVTLTASPATTYLWSNGATTQSITVNIAGSYSVTETNAAGCSASSAATTVSVNANPTVTISGPTSTCPGTPVTLDAGPGFTSYNWSTGATTQTISVSPASTTSYNVVVTNAAGCSASASTSVSVSSAPSVSITAPSAVCANSTNNAASSGAIAGATYVWSISGGTIATGQGTNAITFTAGNGGAVTLGVTVTSGACSGSGTQTVNVIANPSVAITGPSAVCPSASFTLDAGAGFSTYSWSTGATTRTITASQTAQTTYTVTVTSGSCSASASKTVAMTTGGGNVTITAPANAASNSTGNSASVPAGPAGTTYSWSISGGTITAGQGTPAIVWSAGSSTSATISVVVMTGGCSSTGSVTVALSGTADLGVAVSAPASVNTGEVFNYTIAITNAGPSGAKNVTVADTLPSGVTFGSAGGTGWSCSSNGAFVACTAATVPFGNVAPIAISVTAPSTPGSIADGVSISASTTDPNPSNNSSSVTTNVATPAPQCGTTPPSLVSPADGAEGVTNPVTFSWSSVPNAQAYDLWVGSNGASPSIAASTAQTSATLSLPAGPTVWFVATRFANGCAALTSSSRSFTVAAATNCNHGVAQLIAPASGATVTSPVTFQWTAVPAAIGYRVWVAIDGSGAQDVGSTDGALTLTVPLTGSSFQWFVEALFPGCPSTNSAPSTFSIPAADPCAGHAAATLTAPANQSTVASSSVQFQWTPVANANGYRVWTSINGGAFNAVGTTDSAETTLTANIASGNVEWYVQSLFDGCPGVESAHFTFIVPQAQSCPTTGAAIVAPANGATVSNPSVQFAWSAVANAIGYEVWLSLDHGAPALIGTTATTSLAHDVPAGSLEWFVRANFTGCPPLDSAHATFTFAPPPNCSTQHALLSLPQDGDTTASPVDFKWSAVAGASHYNIWIASNGGNATLLGTTSATHLDAQALQPGSYSWYVESAFANGCASTQSSAVAFVVAAPPPPCAPPVAPTLRATSTTSSDVNYTISWPRAGNAAFYEYEESRSPDFADATPVTTYDTSVSFHHPNTTASPIVFYYRVRTVSTCGNARSLFSSSVAVAILPSQVSNAQATGSTPADDPQNVSYTLTIGGTAPGAIPALPGQSFTVVPSASWITANPPSGTVTAAGVPVTITANTVGLPVGTSTGAVTVLLGNASTSGKIAPRAATSSSTTTVSVNLVQAASPTPKNAPPPNALIIPAVAHADGINSHFQSDVRITNTAPQVQRYQITFTPTGTDGNKNGLQTNVAIDPGTTLALDDIMNAWFSSGAAGASATGTLEIRPLTTTSTSTAVSPSSPSSSGVPSITTFASSRTYNTTANGTYGQYIPAIPFSTFIGAPAANAKQTVLSMQQIAQSDAYRTNVGLVEGSGSPATVLLSVFGDGGSKLGEFTQSLSGGQHLQLNSFLATNKLSATDGRIEVRVTGGSGKVTAYASVVDNATNDPLLVSPVQTGLATQSKWVIPGVADLNNGVANWRSDVRLFNAGPTAVNATLTYIAQDGSAPQSKTIAINANEVKQIDGILQSVFGITNSGGALQITTDNNAPLIATARTFNQTSNGTYGQFIPAVTLDDTASKGGRALQLLEVEESDRYRSNIGVTEVSGNPATVEITAIPADSKTAVTTQVSVGPNEFKQFGSLLKSMGIDRAYNARVTVRVVDGDGRIAAYASVIDQKTQDPTYVPAQ